MAKDKTKKTFTEKIQDLILRKLEQMDPELVLEESLYLGVMLLLAAVSGRFKVWVMDGDIRKEDTFLTTQRVMLFGMLKTLHDLSTFKVPFGSIPLLGNDIAPFAWATGLLKGWVKSLSDMEPSPPGAIAGHGQRYWKSVNLLERSLMILILPGILKVAVRSTRQLIQLIK